MRCPQCRKAETKVIESRDVADGESIRRRRECLACQYRCTTYERIERPHLMVVKSDGTRESFNRDKVLIGLRRACEKTPVTNVQLEQVVANVENRVYACGEPEIHSRDIGQYVMDELVDLNEVAYVRFASVYRRFKDIASFEKELQTFRTKQHD